MIPSAELTQVAQSIIKGAGLIDSGRLLNSVKVEYEITPESVIRFELSALYYLQYHIDEIRLIDRLTGHPSFGNLIASLMAPITEAKIGQYLNSNTPDDINFNPQVTMTIEYLDF